MSVKLNRNHLKWIALLTMTIDHIGNFLFPELEWMRLIGRLAFPIFAFFVAEGYYYTHNRKKYFLQLTGFAILTQLAFMLFDVSYVNVLFTFSLAVVALHGLQKHIWLTLLAMLLAVVFKTDYDWYGVAAVLCFYMLRENRLQQALAFFGLTLAYYMVLYGFRFDFMYMILRQAGLYAYNQVLAVLAFIPLFLYDGTLGNIPQSSVGKWLWKYSFYLYYGIHICLLRFLERMM